MSNHDSDHGFMRRTHDASIIYCVVGWCEVSYHQASTTSEETAQQALLDLASLQSSQWQPCFLRSHRRASTDSPGKPLVSRTTANTSSRIWFCAINYGFTDAFCALVSFIPALCPFPVQIIRSRIMIWLRILYIKRISGKNVFVFFFFFVSPWYLADANRRNTFFGIIRFFLSSFFLLPDNVVP